MVPPIPPFAAVGSLLDIEPPYAENEPHEDQAAEQGEQEDEHLVDREGGQGSYGSHFLRGYSPNEEATSGPEGPEKGRFVGILLSLIDQS